MGNEKRAVYLGISMIDSADCRSYLYELDPPYECSRGVLWKYINFYETPDRLIVSPSHLPAATWSGNKWTDHASKTHKEGIAALGYAVMLRCAHCWQAKEDVSRRAYEDGGATLQEERCDACHDQLEAK